MQAVAALRIDGMHDQRLQDAALSDVIGEFVDLSVGELGARVVRVFGDAIQRHDERVAVVAFRRCP